jgi:hypothetical protein
MTTTYDLGSGHQARFYRTSLAEWPIGAVDLHSAPDGSPCGCSLPFADSPVAWRTQTDGSVNPGWQVISHVPLTLIPSIVCIRCGAHGFIIDGKWRSV